MKIFIAGVLAMVVMSTGLVFAQESPLMGKKAPDFTLERLSGRSASLGEVIGDKRGILFFFATWCPHCREQLKGIAARKSEMEKEGVAVVLVDIGEPKDSVAKFLRGYGLDDDAFLDTESFVSEEYQVMGVPTVVLIGVDGKVRFVEYGIPENYLEILK